MSRWKTTRKCNEPITVEIPAVEIEKTSEKETSVAPVSGNRLYFYSDVTRDSIYVLNRQIDELTKQLRIIQIQFNLPKPPPIELFISSEGGEVFSALSTVDKIINNPIPISTHCEGIVASAATLMSVVGKKRTISKNACMLVHQVSGGLWGNYQEFKDEMQNLDLIMRILKGIYLKHAKFTDEELGEMLKHDFVLSPDDCLKYGLVDAIV
jgi:ATP-dependent Clp protease protease subunit